MGSFYLILATRVSLEALGELAARRGLGEVHMEPPSVQKCSETDDESSCNCLLIASDVARVSVVVREDWAEEYGGKEVTEIQRRIGPVLQYIAIDYKWTEGRSHALEFVRLLRTHVDCKRVLMEDDDPDSYDGGTTFHTLCDSVVGEK